MEGLHPQAPPKAVYLKDYRPPDYLVDAIKLHFVLGEEVTTVRSRLDVVRNFHGAQGSRPLVLDGQRLALKSVALNGHLLGPGEHTVDAESLTIPKVPETFQLEIQTQIRPQENTALQGLYKSSGNFCTHCEAEGFRRITYFVDRPDNLARYSTTIVADKQRCPVLLSNGNLIEHGDFDDGRHWAKWEDPFPKPSYLFALVAGDLALVEDEFVTLSGRRVKLHIYVQRHNLDKCEHAVRSLKRAMKWDEEVYGREYDLDNYMIVAVDDFNIGAMENKGLNIFNSKCVLAKPETATDLDYENIQGAIAHEYFHNWSGNRITCRDWFQLSLKEGFTIFREQHFTADMTSGGVKRIHDVNMLRTHQFPEDEGPMAHPVLPESYIEINNFYTATVYEKGAEVVRMLRHFVGPAGFRKGTDLYFSRHDGHAVTTDDFVKAMEDANDIKLTQFSRWFSQAGTPQLYVSRNYDAYARTYILTIRQACPPTPGQPHKAPLHIPIALGLLDDEGEDLPLQLAGEASPIRGTQIISLRQVEESFVFTNVPKEPVLSFLRGFSAPVKLHLDLTDEELAFLMANDSDEFNRWDAGQRLAVKLVMRLVGDFQEGKSLLVDRLFVETFRKTLLKDHALDKALVAQTLTLPSERYLAEFMKVIDPTAIHIARNFVRRVLASKLKDLLLSTYEANVSKDPYRFVSQEVGRRALKNLCLRYLTELDDPAIRQQCLAQFYGADNMTDSVAALASLTDTACPERSEALERFYSKWKDDPLVVDKWFSLQATSRIPGTLEVVKALTQHPAFILNNPNRVRSLLEAFAQANPARFHDPSGAGYELLADYVLQLDPLNPQLAAGLVTAFTLWRRYDGARQVLMKLQLERILNTHGLSKDVYEIVSKSLSSA